MRSSWSGRWPGRRLWNVDVGRKGVVVGEDVSADLGLLDPNFSGEWLAYEYELFLQQDVMNESRSFEWANV